VGFFVCGVGGRFEITMKKRDDYGTPAGSYFESLDEGIAPLAEELRNLILKTIPKVSESIKWGTPVYEWKGSVCAIRTGKDYVALQFGAIGISLDDPGSLLEGTGKRLRHVKVRSRSDIKKKLFASWIKQAAEANLQ
jgi:hypothetical protein